MTRKCVVCQDMNAFNNKVYVVLASKKTVKRLKKKHEHRMGQFVKILEEADCIELDEFQSSIKQVPE